MYPVKDLSHIRSSCAVFMSADSVLVIKVRGFGTVAYSGMVRVIKEFKKGLFKLLGVIQDVPYLFQFSRPNRPGSKIRQVALDVYFSQW